MKPMLGGGLGALSGLMTGLRKFENTGAPKLAAPGTMGKSGMLMGAQQRASLEAGGPQAVREATQGSLLADGGLGSAMDVGWKPTMMQSMTIPGQNREALQGEGYNVPGAGDLFGPMLSRGLLGLLLAQGGQMNPNDPKAAGMLRATTGR